MEAVARAAVVYLFLLVLFRVSGKRCLGQISSFDFILLLIIGEATQQGLLGEDFSLTRAFVVIGTLAVMDLGLSELKAFWPRLDRMIESAPLVVVENGKMLKDRAAREGIDEQDVLTAARERHGLERLDQVKYAVLERSGHISIVPSGDSRA